MMKKDMSANWYQKCLIICSKILLNVLHNSNSTVLVPLQYTELQTSLLFLATFERSFLIFANGAWYANMISSSRFWHHLMFFERNITKILI